MQRKEKTRSVGMIYVIFSHEDRYHSRFTVLKTSKLCETAGYKASNVLTGNCIQSPIRPIKCYFSNKAIQNK